MFKKLIQKLDFWLKKESGKKSCGCNKNCGKTGQ
jgi:hypothetical protein